MFGMELAYIGWHFIGPSVEINVNSLTVSGRDPVIMMNDLRTLSICSNDITYNSILLQDNVSNTCGVYGIYYLFHRYRGHTLDSILSHFSNNLVLNDAVVGAFILKMIIK